MSLDTTKISNRTISVLDFKYYIQVHSSPTTGPILINATHSAFVVVHYLVWVYMDFISLFCILDVWLTASSNSCESNLPTYF